MPKKLGNRSDTNKRIHYSKQFQKKNQKLCTTELPLEASQAMYKWCWYSSIMSIYIFYIQGIKIYYFITKF